MKHVRQKTSPDCGVACIAILSGKTRKKVAKLLDTDRASERGLDATAMRAALAGFGREMGGNFLLTGDKAERIGREDGAVLLRTGKAGGIWHWAVWDGEDRRLLDPEDTKKRKLKGKRADRFTSGYRITPMETD